MKKIKLIILTLLIIFGCTTLAGCSSDDSDELEDKIEELEKDKANLEKEKADLEKQKSDLEKEKSDLEKEKADLEKEVTELKKQTSFEIKVYDIDSENLGEKTFKLSDYSTVYDALDANFEVISTQSSYGHYITSINNSIVDSNYYVAIYENGELSSVGVDSLEINAGDIFEFKVECWNTIESGYGTFDSYDILVDKTLYHYAKTYMKDMISSATAYNDSNYWNYMISNLMISNGYDKNAFTLTNDTVKNGLTSLDVTTLTGANIGKYYWAANALGVDLTNFKTWYQTYINDISTSYSDYVTPFVIPFAKTLGVTSTNLETLVETAKESSTTWGPDALAWQVGALSLFDKYADNTILSKFNYRNTTYGSTSLALQLIAFASLNVSARAEEYEVDSKDIIEVLFDEFFDETLCLVKYKTTDEGTNFSTNQIYASLAAYKVSRDKNLKAYIFA